MVDNDQWLAFGIDTWAMKGVARHDLNICGKMLLEGSDLWSFGRSLTTNDSAHLGRRTESSNNSIDILCFDGIHDPITATGDEMAVLENGDIVLLTFQRGYLDYVHEGTYSAGELSCQRLVLLWNITSMNSAVALV